MRRRCVLVLDFDFLTRVSHTLILNLLHRLWFRHRSLNHSITMVYYFTSTAVDPPVTLYMGKDKFESTGSCLRPQASKQRD